MRKDMENLHFQMVGEVACPILKYLYFDDRLPFIYPYPGRHMYLEPYKYSVEQKK